MFALHQSRYDLSVIIKPYDCDDNRLYGRFGVCDELGITKNIPCDECCGEIVDDIVLENFKGPTIKETVTKNGVETSRVFGILRGKNENGNH